MEERIFYVDDCGQPAPDPNEVIIPDLITPPLGKKPTVHDDRRRPFELTEDELLWHLHNAENPEEEATLKAAMDDWYAAHNVPRTEPTLWQRIVKFFYR